MQFTLPDDIGASLPRQYVDYIGDTELASIVPASLLPERDLDVSIEGNHLHWHLGSEALRVRLTAIFGARLDFSSFGPKDFPVFVLQFGGDSGSGVILLRTEANTTWLREFADAVTPMIPNGVTDALN